MLHRADSSAYWDAEAWDPDERVYTGSALDGCDRFAVEGRQSSGGEHRQGLEAEAAQAAAAEELEADQSPGLRTTLDDSSDRFWDDQQGEAAVGFAMGTMLRQLSPVGEYEVRAAADEMAPADDADYWNAGILGVDSRPAREPPAAPRSEEGARAKLKRVDSSSYWFAEQWDPDCRVYTGAEAGQANHLVAVLETGGEQVFRAWFGGLTAGTLGIEAEVGTPITLAEYMGSSPSVKDLYEIEARSVGAGAFAEVRPGKHRKSGTSCVVKALSKIDVGPKYLKAVQDFSYRMLLKASLDTPHENFVRYLDFLEGPDHFFVVMEQLEGNDLLGKVEADHPFEEAYVRKVFQQVLLALAHLHSTVGLAHRDVKLANFRFRAGSESGLALLDLQFCCPVDADWDQQACGTPALMAPEVTAKSVQKGHLPATDVWSAGVIFFRLMAKDFPFADQQEVDVVSKLGPEAAALVDRAVNNPKLAGYSDEARDLLRSLLTLEAGLRPTAEKALEHAYFGQAAAG